MRKVIVSPPVQDAIGELNLFLTIEHKMSYSAASARVKRIYTALASLGGPADLALCRLRRWRLRGYRCKAIDNWVFAYEVVPEGVIVRDMRHSKLIFDTVD
jgi:hypothetical protein